MKEKQSSNTWDFPMDGSGGAGKFPDHHILKPGRYNTVLVSVDHISIKRGEKYCNPEYGQTPEDLVPKIKFSFLPTSEQVLASCPHEKICEISSMFTPSFNAKAKLPPFLAQLSADGVVPVFAEAKALKAWLMAHCGHEYILGVKPTDNGRYNYITSIAYKGPGDTKGVTAVPEGMVGAKQSPTAPARHFFIDALPVQGSAATHEQVPFDDDDIPF